MFIKELNTQHIKGSDVLEFKYIHYILIVNADTAKYMLRFRARVKASSENSNFLKALQRRQNEVLVKSFSRCGNTFMIQPASKKLLDIIN